MVNSRWLTMVVAFKPREFDNQTTVCALLVRWACPHVPEAHLQLGDGRRTQEARVRFAYFTVLSIIRDPSTACVHNTHTPPTRMGGLFTLCLPERVVERRRGRGD